MAILSAQNITKNFADQEVIKNITLFIEQNTFTAILGPSGSGKSTLLNILSGMNRPTSGAVFNEQIEVLALSEPKLADWKREKIGNVFQNYLLLNNLTAGENIKIGVAPKKTPLPFDRLTNLLNIKHVLKKFPFELSGGEQQRVAIARAVIKSPDILFCDEATGALDEMNSKNVVELLHMLKKTFEITILFTTHNQQISKTADRIITIKDGILSQDVLNQSPIEAQEMVWG